MVLLGTLFVSSCYWQPFYIDTRLSLPWSENITTYAEALNATLASSNYTNTEPLPLMIRAVDRCWCDVSSGEFFEPFNISRWERATVYKLKDDLEQSQRMKEQLEQLEKLKEVGDAQRIGEGDQEQEQGGATTTGVNGDTCPGSGNGPQGPKAAHLLKEGLLSFFHSFRNNYNRPIYRLSVPSTTTLEPTPVISTPTDEPTPVPPRKLPLLRREYDLRPLGIGMTIDFGWTR